MIRVMIRFEIILLWFLMEISETQSTEHRLGLIGPSCWPVLQRIVNSVRRIEKLLFQRLRFYVVFKEKIVLPNLVFFPENSEIPAASQMQANCRTAYILSYVIVFFDTYFSLFFASHRSENFVNIPLHCWVGNFSTQGYHVRLKNNLN